MMNRMPIENRDTGPDPFTVLAWPSTTIPPRFAEKPTDAIYDTVKIVNLCPF
ncbi:hypothetical protein E1B28_002065 [Marasmius oreades]|uniref:Uncharacterized protein n=1 Tax=Marasmius oreades TaxID=181124 RepID=A0A9P7V4Y7_9AGAR|nr:uncharacterized protein E1B28_002065 [Marasmius oreades]KAG7100292.1 hypothetical protein E1B28_002065 [Marasmius oreades]